MFDDSDEAFARELVAIMRMSNRQPGTGMLPQSLLTKFGWERLADWKQGLAFALKQKWFEEGPNGFLLLTKEAPTV